MVLWQGTNYLAPLLTFPHLARTLHPAGFGLLGIYLLISGWMTIASDWGTNYTGSRLIAQNNAQFGDIDEAFWEIFFLRVIIATVILTGIVIYLVATNAGLSEILLLLSAWTIILGNTITVSWCLQGLERLDAFATAAVVGRLFTVPATIFLVTRPSQVWLAIAVQGAGGIIIGITSIVMLYRSRCVKQLRFSWRGCWRQWLDGMPVLISTASHGLYSSTSTALLGIFHGPNSTGIFVAADRIRLAAQGIVMPIGQALYPRVSRLAVTDRRAAVKTIRQLGLGLGLLLIPGCTALALLAPAIIRIIAGPEFSPSVSVLRISACTVAVFGANAVLGWQTLMPFGESKTFSKITSSAAAFNILVMPGLVYYFSSLGAATGVLLTEAFMLICYVTVVLKANMLAINSP
jgi:PST family polysaccharide transporter